jgi:hypothetical protein
VATVWCDSKRRMILAPEGKQNRTFTAPLLPAAGSGLIKPLTTCIAVSVAPCIRHWVASCSAAAATSVASRSVVLRARSRSFPLLVRLQSFRNICRLVGDAGRFLAVAASTGLLRVPSAPSDGGAKPRV